MSPPERVLFTADWPRYAVAAHIAFWGSAAVSLVTGCGAIAGLFPSRIALWSLGSAVIAGFVLGVSALTSGRLYVGNQVFDRTPTTGWAARLCGAFISLGAAGLIFFAYALTQMRGV
jgi:hypothetical protein